MSRYDHKIETSLEGIENLSKEKNEEKERKVKEKNHYYNPLILCHFLKTNNLPDNLWTSNYFYLKKSYFQAKRIFFNITKIIL